MIVNPFSASPGTTQLTTSGAASASITFSTGSIRDPSVRIVNYGATNPVYIRLGTGAQTATTADLLVRANSEIILLKGDGVDTLAYIQSGGATTIAVSTGNGGT